MNFGRTANGGGVAANSGSALTSVLVDGRGRCGGSAAPAEPLGVAEAGREPPEEEEEKEEEEEEPPLPEEELVEDEPGRDGLPGWDEPTDQDGVEGLAD